MSLSDRELLGFIRIFVERIYFGILNIVNDAEDDVYLQ